MKFLISPPDQPTSSTVSARSRRGAEAKLEPKTDSLSRPSVCIGAVGIHSATAQDDAESVAVAGSVWGNARAYAHRHCCCSSADFFDEINALHFALPLVTLGGWCICTNSFTAGAVEAATQVSVTTGFEQIRRSTSIQRLRPEPSCHRNVTNDTPHSQRCARSASSRGCGACCWQSHVGLPQSRLRAFKVLSSRGLSSSDLSW